MSFLLYLLTAPASLPVKGFLWVAEKITEQAENELYDEQKIRGQLMELELKLDLGEITEEEYMAAEDELMERLRMARERKAQRSQS